VFLIAASSLTHTQDDQLPLADGVAVAYAALHAGFNPMPLLLELLQAAASQDELLLHSLTLEQ
jgi:hypothetical protein